MDKSDQNDIIKKVKSAGSNNIEDTDNEDISNDENLDNTDNQEDKNNSNEELNENNEQFILQNPKKSSIFAPKGSKEYMEANDLKETIKNRLNLLKEAYVDSDGNFQDKKMRDPNLIEFDVPEWALSSLINGDDSGLEDEDINKINNFVQGVVNDYGNAHFMMDDIEGEDNLGFKHSNDIDNLGSNVYRLYINPSKEIKENNTEVKPVVKPETKPITTPTTEPLRRDKPFLPPTPKTNPDPKANTKDTLIDENINNSIDLNKIVHSYLHTALWSGDLDEFDVENISEDSRDKAIADCKLFIKLSRKLLNGLDSTDIGHDFWLTRNRHGAGFWDGDYPEGIGEQLTKISHQFPEINTFNENGVIYIE